MKMDAIPKQDSTNRHDIEAMKPMSPLLASPAQDLEEMRRVHDKSTLLMDRNL
jgi:hypothetical protein